MTLFAPIHATVFKIGLSRV